MANDVVVNRAVKRFGRVTALDAISFSSRKGINIILGPNGAGKSTLLRSISGLYELEGGTISVLGSNPYTDTDLRRRVSFLADNYGLYDFLSVRKNLGFFGKFYGLGEKEAIAKAMPLMKELDLMQYFEMRVETLSRGTKQKVAFCRSMLNDAEVLLLDEPTAFLDVKATNTVRSLLKGLADENKTVIFVTQRIDEVARYNSRILVLRKGRMVKDTDIEGLYSAVLRNAHVTIRLAKPVKANVLDSLRNVVGTNAKEPTSVTVRVHGYKEVNRAVSELMKGGAYVVGIDYLEPEIDKLVFGEKG